MWHYHFGSDVTWKQGLLCVCVARVSSRYPRTIGLHVGPCKHDQLNATDVDMEKVWQRLTVYFTNINLQTQGYRTLFQFNCKGYKEV